MTQLSLFDVPSAISTGAPATASSTGAPVTATSTGAPVAAAAMVTPVVTPSAVSRVDTATEPPPHREGLNHMGDLAKLVLLRYDLAAKRRADAASRRRRAR